MLSYPQPSSYPQITLMRVSPSYLPSHPHGRICIRPVGEGKRVSVIGLVVIVSKRRKSKQELKQRDYNRQILAMLERDRKQNLKLCQP